MNEDPYLWTQLERVFKRGSFQYELGYALLNGTPMRYLSDKERKALDRLAGDEAPISAYLWSNYEWRTQLFYRLLAEEKEANNLLRNINRTVRKGGRRRRTRRA